MRIGEKQSELTDLDTLIEDELGELYEDLTHKLIGKPLDFGRFIYAKLRIELDDQIGEEVWWDHNSACAHIEVVAGAATITTRVNEADCADSRQLFIAQVEQLVRHIKAEVGEWL